MCVCWHKGLLYTLRCKINTSSFCVETLQLSALSAYTEIYQVISSHFVHYRWRKWEFTCMFRRHAVSYTIHMHDISKYQGDIFPWHNVSPWTKCWQNKKFEIGKNIEVLRGNCKSIFAAPVTSNRRFQKLRCIPEMA